MSLTNYEEVKCPCGYIFEIELYSSINIQQNPELKEKILGGELNVVVCPECNMTFYAERFILYLDRKAELLAFVYPSSFASDKDRWEKKISEDFEGVQKELPDKQQFKYAPILFFGLDSLVELLKYENAQYDEIMILKHISKNSDLKLFKISPSEIRKIYIPHVLPRIPLESRNLRDEIIAGLRKLLDLNPDLMIYREFFNRISNDVSWQQIECVITSSLKKRADKKVRPKHLVEAASNR